MGKMRLLFCCATTCLGLALALPAFAGWQKEVARDFRPLSGVVVMPVDGEYLIDLDASKGVVEGDLFSVLVPGREIVHPVTGEVLGRLEEVKGQLQVTRVKSGYSHARPVGEKRAFEKGEVIRRYEQVPAGVTGEGSEEILAPLRTALPHLDWQSSKDGGVLLTFDLRGGRLIASGPEGTTIRSYETAGASSAVGAVPRPGAEGAIVAADPVNRDDIWTAASLTGNPLGLEIANLDGEPGAEYALLYADRLEVGRIVDGQAKAMADYPRKRADKFLTLSSVDLDGNGLPELYVTAVDQMELSSLALEFREGALEVLQGYIPYYLRAVRVPGEGKILLGQRMGDLKKDFDTPIFQMGQRGGKLEAGPAFATPWGVTVFGSTPLAGEGGERLYANLSDTGRLRVHGPEGDELWESSQDYGGSDLTFRRPDTTGGADYATREVAVKPSLIAAEGGVLLAPVNEKGLLKTSFSNLGPSRVVALRWDGRGLRELWHTRPQEGYMPDFSVGDIDNDGKDEIAMIVVESRTGMFNKGRSSLVVYELP